MDRLVPGPGLEPGLPEGRGYQDREARAVDQRSVDSLLSLVYEGYEERLWVGLRIHLLPLTVIAAGLLDPTLAGPASRTDVAAGNAVEVRILEAPATPDPFSP